MAVSRTTPQARSRSPKVEDTEVEETNGEIEFTLSKDKKNLIITVPLNFTPPPSKSGLTKTVGTTGGFNWDTGVQHLGKAIGVSLNCSIKK